ncbi:MAG: bifunctional phosphoribosyl-AMP cyclohydrolase/phosphoribosyl-ATP diphosphatase HisIE [Deltaproteobacteria bacterium]|nr:bifunctional phosphoribosyl-AMP cyclohydrolase/phosphoribosyl-ATP diphosphatase HisIE [Deltaproteobacteria bacterium]
MSDFVRAVKFGEGGLVPAIAQDHATNQVLMLAYMNEEALRKTLSTGRVHYFSRSRRRLWLKGATSGHFQYLKRILFDCDNDTLLLRVEQIGAACHTGHRSCFFSGPEDGVVAETVLWQRSGAGAGHELPDSAGIIDAVYDVILQRKANPPRKSYVHSLMARGIDAVNSKIIEEAGEVTEAGREKKDGDVVYEAADLIFHLLVLLGYRGIAPREVYGELKRRFGVSGIDEKASRNKK